jgi:hypothetical protein
MSLLNSWPRSAKFPAVGTRVGGRVVRDAEEIQQRDFDTGEPLTWADGNPRMQLVVTVDTGNPDPDDPDDDGERSIYVKGQMLSATRAACKKAKKFVIAEGDVFAVTFVAEEPLPKGKRGLPKKVYEVEFVPAASGGSGLLAEPATPAPAKPTAKTSRARSVLGAASNDLTRSEPPF